MEQTSTAGIAMGWGHHFGLLLSPKGAGVNAARLARNGSEGCGAEVKDSPDPPSQTEGWGTLDAGQACHSHWQAASEGRLSRERIAEVWGCCQVEYIHIELTFEWRESVKLTCRDCFAVAPTLWLFAFDRGMR
jgi:hypothetical protein